MPQKLRGAMNETISGVINLYLRSFSELKTKHRREKKEKENKE
jgi:hypothetical protein